MLNLDDHSDLGQDESWTSLYEEATDFLRDAQLGPADPARLAAVRTTAYRTTTGGSER